MGASRRAEAGRVIRALFLGLLLGWLLVRAIGEREPDRTDTR